MYLPARSPAWKEDSHGSRIAADSGIGTEAASDFQIATDGTKRPDNCQFTVTVAEIILTDVIEIIPATETAEKRIKEIKEWKR